MKYEAGRGQCFNFYLQLRSLHLTQKKSSYDFLVARLTSNVRRMNSGKIIRESILRGFKLTVVGVGPAGIC